MKLIINSSTASDTIHDELLNQTGLYKAEKRLADMFKGDEILNGTKGLHDEESGQLGKELFSSLFENPDRIENPKSWARVLIDSLENSDLYRPLSAHCKNNKYKSATTAARLLEHLSSKAKELRKIQKEEEEDFGEEDIQIDYHQDELEDLEDILDHITPKIIEEFNLDDQLGELIAANHDMSLASPEKGESIGKRLLDSVKRNPALLEIFKKAGSLLEAMDSKTVKDQESIENLIGVTQGRDLKALTPSSKFLLCNLVTEAIFYDKFCRNQLDIFDYEGEINKSRGPIMLLIDESGSMGSVSRNNIASAIGVAFTHMAVKEERPITIIGFNGGVTNVYQVKDRKCFSTRDKKDIGLSDLLMELATRRPRGGTNFDAPINKAFDLNPLEEKADLILVTDGQAPISDQTLERINEYKKEGMKFYSILLGVAGQTLCKFSDEIIDIEKISNANKKTVIGSIMNSVRD